MLPPTVNRQPPTECRVRRGHPAGYARVIARDGGAMWKGPLPPFPTPKRKLMNEERRTQNEEFRTRNLAVSQFFILRSAFFIHLMQQTPIPGDGKHRPESLIDC
jgi:hypothetical protein